MSTPIIYPESPNFKVLTFYYYYW